MKIVKMILILGLFTAASHAGEDAKNLLMMETVGPRTEAVALEDYQHVFYVSVSMGSDQAGDGSKSYPWKTISHALTRLSSPSSTNRYAFLVGAGTYSQGTVEMKPFADLYGGFSPESWERDIFKHRTILDGEGVRRVVLSSDHARIDGFVIANGLAQGHGGGILCLDASPVISNNFILGNRVLEQKDFDHKHIHQDGHHGGGIAVIYNSIPVIKNNVIAGNQTSIGMGGGVAFYGLLRMKDRKFEIIDNFMVSNKQSLCENNVIVGNTTGMNDLHRTRSSSGGGIACAHEVQPVIRNNVVAMNQAKGRSDAGGIYTEFYAFPIIEGNWVVGNVSDDDGGGMYTMRLGQPLIRENIIAGNWTLGNGCGGIRVSKEGRARIIGNRIVHNPTGPGMQCVESYMEFENNIVMDNRNGPGLLFRNYFSYFQPSVARNNVIRRNGEKNMDVKASEWTSLIVEDSNIEGGYEGPGNVDEDPGFKDDSLTGMVKSHHFNPDLMTTVLTLKKTFKKDDDFSGRVIRVGDQWSVVKESRTKYLIVWGDMTVQGEGELEYHVIPTYSK